MRKNGWILSAGWISLAFVLGSMSAEEAFAQTTQTGDVSDDDSPSSTNGIDDIVVTATRHSESINRVPMSIAAYDQERLDQQGARSVDDVTRLTPGVNFNRSGFGLTSSISIRGISSGSGSATTGIYIDDTPIQVRSLGNSSSNTYPVVFDLDRVEVLRGPQGTLFGAASEGGNIRFITPRPNLNSVSGYGRGEFEVTKNGSPSYEAGAALGAPIVEDRLGFRVSAYVRRDGGFVDRKRYLGDTVDEKDSNRLDSTAFRAALGWQPTDNLTITPSIFFQDVKLHDTQAVWANLSDAKKQRYINGNDARSPSRDRLLLPALLVEWDFGGVELVSNTSYFHRKEHSRYDYTLYDISAFAPGGDPAAFYSNPDFYSNSPQSNRQDNWTQEIRLQSNDPSSRLNWVVGAFWSKARQRSTQIVDVPFLGDYFGLETEEEFIDFWGVPFIDGTIGYIDNFDATDKQIAGFGEVTYEILDGLKLTAGIRASKNKFHFTNFNDGPVSGGPRSADGRSSESPVTPKFSVSYQADPNNLFYATVAKGYRVGGANRALPVTPNCTAALEALGLDAAPSQYKSDSVWSYEVGSKNRFANGRIAIAASAYWIDWSNIIRAVGDLGNCPYAFTTNLGSATSKGFDLQIDTHPTDALSLGVAVGYNKATFSDTIHVPDANRDIVTAGHTLGGAPWTVVTTGEYDFSINGMDSYFRAIYEFRSSNRGLTPTRDPQNANYDPLLLPLPEIHDLQLRAGVRLDAGWDVSIFIKNALNKHPLLNYGRDGTTAQVFSYSPTRPISGGITAAVRF